MGKFLAFVLIASSLLIGGGIYYAQVYAYYETVTLSDDPDTPFTTQILLTRQADQTAEPIRVSDFEGIDATSSPLRFRGCFTIAKNPADLAATYVAFEGSDPLIGPNWFDCYDAKTIGGDLEAGRATAYLSQSNITYGVDRVIAVYPDGRAYAWHQLNNCGTVVYSGKPAPEGCPAPPESSR